MVVLVFSYVEAGRWTLTVRETARDGWIAEGRFRERVRNGPRTPALTDRGLEASTMDARARRVQL